jgi:hypothetical protein
MMSHASIVAVSSYQRLNLGRYTYVITSDQSLMRDCGTMVTTERCVSLSNFHKFNVFNT